MVSPESVKHKEPEKGGGTMVDLFIVMVDVKLYAFNDVKLLFYIHIYIYMTRRQNQLFMPGTKI